MDLDATINCQYFDVCTWVHFSNLQHMYTIVNGTNSLFRPGDCKFNHLSSLLQLLAWH
jgi:hypothetical protein